MNKAVYRIISVMAAFALTFGSYSYAGASLMSAPQTDAASYNNAPETGDNANAAKSALQTQTTRMLIPLYSYPPGQWASVVSANTYRNIDVIVNPSNGPGASLSSSYVTGIAQLRSAGVGVLGYVYTGYGTRPLATVKAEVDTWQNWYGVDGIFFDEADNTDSGIPYYSELQTYVTAKSMTLILNPGTIPTEAYASVANTNVIYENDPSIALTTPAWAANYPASKFAVLQYAASIEQMRSLVALAKSQNIGYIYVTNDIKPNPWNDLPSYLAEEAALLANGTVPPSPTPTITQPATSVPTLTQTLPAPTQTAISSIVPTLTSGKIKFAVIGDFGSAGKTELDVANLVKSWSPDFVITTGDNNYNDGAASTIDANIGQYYHDFIGNYTGTYGAGSTTNRFFPSLGNHDWVQPNAQPYINYFTLPGNEYYYDYIEGPVHFFVLDSDSRTAGGISPTGVQGTWLKNQLAASTSVWNVVYFHASPYSSGLGHGSYAPMQWPFKLWGADVVLSGHEHIYERLTVDGLTYFINGVGGAGLYNIGTPVTGSQVRYNALNGAMLIEADSNVIDFKFINKLGTVIDSYSLTANPTSPTITPNVTPSITATVPTLPTVAPTQTVAPATPTTVSAAGQNIFEVRVAKGMDDVEESATGSMYVNSSDLELVYDGSNQVVGIRFAGVNVPKGATITNAYLQFKVDETSSSATTVSVQGEASPNAPIFASTSRNVSSRLKTSSVVSWSPASWLTLGTAGSDQRTPNLAPIVQEIVNQTSWAAGNSMVMIIAGSGKRTAQAYEVNPSGAPLLHIEFTMLTSATNTPTQIATVTSTGLPTATPTTSPANTSTPIPFTPTLTAPVVVNSPTATLVSATPTTVSAAGQSTFEVRVAKGMDDVEESATGNMYVNSSDLELVYDGSNQVVGIRFAGVNVPKGATITNAYLQFKVDETSSSATTVSVQGEASPNAPIFASTSRNVSSRLKTSSVVSWSPASWLTLGTAGSDQRTPNLAPIVQEIVNQTSWAAGNSMVMIIAGSGKRTAQAYEVNPSGAPLLHIEFTMPTSATNTPTQIATATSTGLPTATPTNTSVPFTATPTVPVGVNSPTATLAPATPTPGNTDTPSPTEAASSTPTGAPTAMPTETPIAP